MNIYMSMALSFLIGGLLSFLIKYLNQKGKNSAFLEEINKLEAEKQAAILEKETSVEKLKSQFNHDLEVQKKQFTLVIENKKYKYESKKNEYYTFMAYLDVFNNVQMKALHDDFWPVITSYYQADVTGLQKKSEEKSIEFNNKCLLALSKFREQQGILFSQVNGLKLSASEQVMQVISELIEEIQVININFQDLLEELDSPDFQFQQVLSNDLFSKGQNEQEKITLLRENLLRVMKADLDKL
ncbi:hypothetical protein [Psychromonas ingrahamii]|nr:hypothetical protein [Psychromonas ingrahamii]